MVHHVGWLLLKGLADASAEISPTSQGPSASIAYDADGNATKAAIGFARGKGLDVADLSCRRWLYLRRN